MASHCVSFECLLTILCRFRARFPKGYGKFLRLCIKHSVHLKDVLRQRNRMENVRTTLHGYTLLHVHHKLETVLNVFRASEDPVLLYLGLVHLCGADMAFFLSAGLVREVVEFFAVMINGGELRRQMQRWDGVGSERQRLDFEWNRRAFARDVRVLTEYFAERGHTQDTHKEMLVWV